MNGRKNRYGRRNEERDLYPSQPFYPHGGLFAGFYGIVATTNGKYDVAALWILISSIFDGLDGKVARLTGTSSKFGVEYDSLGGSGRLRGRPRHSHVLLGAETIRQARVAGGLSFCRLRRLSGLARFNVQVNTVESKRFVGLPIPAAASMVSATVLLVPSLRLARLIQEACHSCSHLSSGLSHGLQFPLLLLQGPGIDQTPAVRFPRAGHIAPDHNRRRTGVRCCRFRL
ncbi:MAG: CDP-alcohol phosphatidyltransferase family protein [Desulfomicrobium escambiense]|nr:CDP-alcohol phosphatidyltransferase family protein [Desulfomicrobium escambiense]